MFGILVIVSVNVINLVVLVSIQIIQTVRVEKKLLDPLVEECTENIKETKLVNMTVNNENKDRYSFYTVYRILFWMFFIFFIISSKIIIYFVYHKYVNRIKYDLPY